MTEYPIYVSPNERLSTDNCTFEDICALAAQHAQGAYTLCELHTAEYGITFEDVTVRLHVEIKGSGGMVGSAWDQVVINGVASANRHAGRDRVMALYAPVILRAALAFDAVARGKAA